MTSGLGVCSVLYEVGFGNFGSVLDKTWVLVRFILAGFGLFPISSYVPVKKIAFPSTHRSYSTTWNNFAIYLFIYLFNIHLVHKVHKSKSKRIIKNSKKIKPQELYTNTDNN